MNANGSFIVLLLVIAIISLLFLALKKRQAPCSDKKKETLNYHPDQFAEKELHFLRTQMNPHFLFNSFNTIKLLIQQTRNEEAIDYLGDFSKLVRSIVNNAEKSTILLKEELELAELFLSLESLRYKKRIQLSIDVSNDLNLTAFEVPPMLLRSYLEKVVWRNRHTEGNIGQLSIKVVQEEGNLCIILEDDGLSHIQAEQMIEQRKKSNFFIERGVYQQDNFIRTVNQPRQNELLVSEKYDQSAPLGKNRLIITVAKKTK